MHEDKEYDEIAKRKKRKMKNQKRKKKRRRQIALQNIITKLGCENFVLQSPILSHWLGCSNKLLVPRIFGFSRSSHLMMPAASAPA
jgi:hypothetical protein